MLSNITIFIFIRIVFIKLFLSLFMTKSDDDGKYSNNTGENTDERTEAEEIKENEETTNNNDNREEEIKTVRVNSNNIKNEEEYMNLFDNSVVGKFSKSTIVQNIKSSCLSLAGSYYVFMHMLFMILIGIIIFFVTKKSYLCMTLLVISLDAIANVVFFDCPLSSLEKKYLKTSMIETRLNSLQKYGMMYANNRYYDTQLEVIINGWTLCAAKILCLIVFDWFAIDY